MTELVGLLTTDLVGITRGRFLPVPSREHVLANGCGWVPANLALTPFDTIADDNPWGSRGDLRLMPDLATRFRTERTGPAPFGGILCDITDLEGAPWYGCGRSFLKRALEDLRDEFGLTLIAAFEAEFQLVDGDWHSAPAFSVQALRRMGTFCPDLVDVLVDLGAEPEAILPEYGDNQLEIVCAPSVGVVAADRAVVVREAVREVARLHGKRATFTPKLEAQGVGNGLHIHFSFVDSSGNPVGYDPSQEAGVSSISGAFAAGILRHMPALLTFTAPAGISYRRLVSHHWSAAYTTFGAMDREAAIRVCPLPASAKNPSKAFNLEYRAADSTAGPHWALGALVRAGLEGLRHALQTPALIHGDPENLGPADMARLDVRRLPSTLGEALLAFKADPVVSGWLDPVLVEGLRTAKLKEIATISGWDDAAVFKRYSEIY